MEARTAWTDERLDDLADSLRSLPAEVAKVAGAVEGLREETRALRTDLTEETRALRTDLREETRALRTDLTEETRSIRGDLSASQRQIAQIGWVLAIALVSAIAGLLIALL